MINTGRGRKEIEMEYIAQKSKYVDGWVVEAIDFDNEGVIYGALFQGHDDEKRAKEYADWKNNS